MSFDEKGYRIVYCQKENHQLENEYNCLDQIVFVNHKPTLLDRFLLSCKNFVKKSSLNLKQEDKNAA